jgi:hypothetical protein
VSFFDPVNPTTKAETDFVSVRGDLRGIPGSVFLVAFDINGNQIASDTQPDSGGALLSVAAAGIHTVRMFSGTGTVAFDDLTFNPVVAVPGGAVPEPNTCLLLAACLALAVFRRRRTAGRRGGRLTWLLKLRRSQVGTMQPTSLAHRAVLIQS